MKKGLLILLTLVLMVIGFSETLVIKGSNTIFPVAQLWIENLKEINPDLNITLEGAGSSTGISALFNETTDIANSSRWLKDKEIEKMHEEKKLFMPIVVGYDGIALIVNKELGIDSITIEELKKIYTGEIRTWKQLNSNLPNSRIVIYSRNTASGTFETFENKVLDGAKMDPTVKMVESTQFEIDQVSRNKYAIAYVGAGYVNDSVKVLKVENELPTKLNILNSIYPISRPLYMFVDVTNGYPETGKIKEYITYALSKDGQEMVEKAGYVAAYGF
ncbi:phosphate ABC transporter substrate-binding protein PstS family protein [Oceanotoga sp. DSM 15011]|jgi:phosphate transport system substrate-binding protein|uniref:Phosphate-binding protein n=1 Tax=Oceanotoga teriensis TaxID=515440 RepID=A0AA45HI55_9BACT|nr:MULTISPECIES: phosphate ABC transporter substrate-binding protein PstS family protein [Oceanotoga]MDN5341461.1 phosphate transport system substrate-binding protein [Oceanotoga sp.]MDO7977629.1 phosphate ABC transporter substrate-binding protein PstS family protein [Oceanotoga teriensis]PWJ90082.1 phosphate ABC transporter substrate-binding protein (PhoT family) [Oceanotoga teriensis]UYP00492.1 phosphate ABC transporter substrate-binding protein PstS family protein [Oceanotoga sp. DSM 15011]